MSLNILITANFQPDQQHNYHCLDCIKAQCGHSVHNVHQISIVQNQFGCKALLLCCDVQFCSNEMEKNVWSWISAPYETFSFFSMSRCKHHPVTLEMSHNWQQNLNITSVQPTATTHTPLMWKVWKYDHLICIFAIMLQFDSDFSFSIPKKNKKNGNMRLSPLSLGPWSGRIRSKLDYQRKLQKKLEVLKGELISPECVSAVGFTQASAVWSAFWER